MTDWVIGVDGGQTSCKCILATTGGEILSRGFAFQRFFMQGLRIGAVKG